METEAHDQSIEVKIVEHVPTHSPRKNDPYYKFFNEARLHMKRLGLLRCWVCGTLANIQVHHNLEYCFLNALDWQRVRDDHLDWNITTEEEFKIKCEQEGNLTALCQPHHTGRYGIHFLPYPQFLANKYSNIVLAEKE